MTYPIEWIRSQFPAIAKAEAETPAFIFSDNAAGGQIPGQALDFLKDFIENQYVLGGAHYNKSLQMEERVEKLRSKVADFLGSGSAEEIVFGLNATNMLRLLSTSIGETLKSGDEIIISGQEHEANVTPWLRLQSKGIIIKHWPPRGAEAGLKEGDLIALLSKRTKIVAVTGASNLLAEKNDLARFAELAHEDGAILVVDGVHLAPHIKIDVVRDNIDFFVCSGYKIYGPRLAMAYAKQDLLDSLPSLNHYFLKKGKLEIGAQNYEGTAIMEGVFDYFQRLHEKLGLDAPFSFESVFAAMGEYENMLTERFLTGTKKIKGLTVYGINDPARSADRLSTFSLNLEGWKPEDFSKAVAGANIACRWGHMYAARLADTLRVSGVGGVVRISLCHYNTVEEVDRILAFIASL
jgi:cysteine desulfurase family protein (TIGR01976 family)